MREIKFRAWDKSEEVMCRVDAIALTADVFEWGSGITDEHNDFHAMVDVELMQFTGLKDANGVEWYEGDILGLIDDEEDKSRCEIIFEDGAFRRYWRHGCDGGEPFSNSITPFDLTFWKVIGNIHENGDLLK